MLPPAAVARSWPTSQNRECAAGPSELTKLPTRSQPAHVMDTRVQTGLVWTLHCSEFSSLCLS